jgi:hypothetical protein
VNDFCGVAFTAAFGLRVGAPLPLGGRGDLAAAFAREAVFRGFGVVLFAFAWFTGLVVPFVWVDPSTEGTDAPSEAAVSLTFFELFAIYFSYPSASLYVQSKTAQAEISMKPLSSCLSRQ